MNTLPTNPNELLKPAEQGERETALWALFSQFQGADGDEDGKLFGYHMALRDEPLWAIERAVQRFVAGAVRGQSLKWLPTSAELAVVVREEVAFARRMREREECRARPLLTDDGPSEEQRREVLARNAERIAGIGGRPDELRPLPSDRITPARCQP